MIIFKLKIVKRFTSITINIYFLMISSKDIIYTNLILWVNEKVCPNYLDELSKTEYRCFVGYSHPGVASETEGLS